jgi:hypothetical protein
MCFLRKLSAGLRARWLRGSIDKALALSRYEARPDGLELEGTSFNLAISWRPRGIHPWDSDMTVDRKAARLVEQTFTDTLAALERLFIALPEIDVIDLKVLEADTRKHGILLSGSISQREFDACRVLSPAMRLRLLGVNYNLVNSCLESLAPSCSKHETTGSGINALPGGQSFDSAQSGDLGKEPPQVWHQGKIGPH